MTLVDFLLQRVAEDEERVRTISAPALTHSLSRMPPAMTPCRRW